MRVSVLIPTFQRPQFLAKAFRGLDSQERAADQVVLGTRAGDAMTAAFLSGHDRPACNLVVATTPESGVIAAMNAAARLTDGDIVCLLDDDAEPRPDWIARIIERFESDNQLGFIGGRDLLQDHPEMRESEATTANVGIFSWYGRIVGNHHRGHGPARRVDFLKGCNAAIRGRLLRRLGIEARLQGDGAQVHWEMALCLDVARAGYAVAYDPAIRVIHHIAPRFGADQSHRGTFSREGLYDMVWNEHFIIGSRTSARRRLAHLFWAIMVGSPDAPGLLRAFQFLARGDRLLPVRIATTARAIFAARRSAARARVNPDEKR